MKASAVNRSRTHVSSSNPERVMEGVRHTGSSQIDVASLCLKKVLA